MSELKPCPFCKAELEQFNAVAVAHPSCGTGYCLLSGRVLVPSEFDRFNRRPIEDELRAKLKVAEEALVEIERGGCGTMCDDHPEGYHYLSCPWRIATYALARIRE